jgi:hypothetical protein
MGVRPLAAPCRSETRLIRLLKRIQCPNKFDETLRLMEPLLAGLVTLNFMDAPIDATRATYCPVNQVIELNTALNDIELLYLFLHECGHAFLQSHTDHIRPANWLEEKAVEALALWIASDVFAYEELYAESTFLHNLEWTVEFYKEYYKTEKADFFEPDDSIRLLEKFKFTLYLNENQNTIFTQDTYAFDPLTGLGNIHRAA